MEFIIIYLVLINSLGLLFFKIDKQRALRNKWRISERSLWLVAYLGGALGSWIGMKRYQHKTRHRTFKYGLPILLFIQGIIVILINGYNCLS